MSDTQTTISILPEIQIPSKRWVELPCGDTLHVHTVEEEKVEGNRTVRTGSKIRFTGQLEDWLAIVARYGSL
jgi:hypothetical protein